MLITSVAASHVQVNAGFQQAGRPVVEVTQVRVFRQEAFGAGQVGQDLFVGLGDGAARQAGFLRTDGLGDEHGAQGGSVVIGVGLSVEAGQVEVAEGADRVGLAGVVVLLGLVARAGGLAGVDVLDEGVAAHDHIVVVLPQGPEIGALGGFILPGVDHGAGSVGRARVDVVGPQVAHVWDIGTVEGVVLQRRIESVAGYARIGERHHRVLVHHRIGRRGVQESLAGSQAEQHDRRKSQMFDISFHVFQD